MTERVLTHRISMSSEGTFALSVQHLTAYSPYGGYAPFSTLFPLADAQGASALSVWNPPNNINLLLGASISRPSSKALT